MVDGTRSPSDSERTRVLSILKGLVGAETFKAWCQPLQWEAAPDSVRVFAPNPFYLNHLEITLKAPLTEAFSLVAERPLKVVFEMRAAAKPAPEVANGAPRVAMAPLESPKNPAVEDVPIRESDTHETAPPKWEESPRATSRAGYAEANFTRLPFALVNDKEIKTAKEIVIDVTLRSPGGLQRRLWRATPGASGMPGPFDHAVFRAIERFALDSTIRRGVPLRGPVFFHLKTIIEMLGLYYCSKNIRFISNAFDRLQELSIEDMEFLRRARPRAEGSPGRKKSGRGRGARGKIHLVDRIKAAGEIVPDGNSVAVSGTYAVTFGREYEDSVNDHYIRPLDWELWIGLKRPVARRLVELLDMDFYGLRNGPHVAYEYSELCGLLPSKIQRFLSLAKNVLDPAHEELAQAGYLRYDWETASNGRWRILYNPGPRWYAFQNDLGHGIEVTKTAKDLAIELGEPKRSRFYQQVLNRVDPAYVNEALQDLRAAVREGRAPENKAAWFLGALKGILEGKGLPLFPLV